MQVFTENWLEALACRYRDYKRHTRPFVYFVATEDEFKLTRDQIEEWVALMPANLRKKAIARLQSEAGFKQTYHELAVGDILRGLGFQTDYEMDFNGQTPDWCVFASDGSKFIVEVFTENTSRVVETWDARLSELQGRISELPFDFALGVDVPFDWNSVCLDSKRSKTIANAVKSWLLNDSPPIGTELKVDELSFEVVLRDRKFAHVMLMGFGRFFWVNPEPLRRNIDAKIDKYKALVESNRIPLVVAVAAEFRTGYGIEELENILFREGLFVKKPLLSGAIWASKLNLGRWGMKGYSNPHAQYPLPEKIFA